VVIGSGASQIDFTTGDEGRLSEVTRSFEIESEPVTDAASFAYDGRSFLCRVENVLGGSEDVEYVEPVYSSEGLLHGLTRVEFVPVGEEGETEARTTEFSVKELDSATEWVFLTTDHLGTPLLATDLSGNDHWAGPFEPFGKDFFQLAQSSGVFLRLPGQWDDPIWQNPTAGAGIYYNVHRWYENGIGRYGRPDPLSAEATGETNPYHYSRSNPVLFIDPVGLISCACGDDCPGGEWLFNNLGFSIALVGGTSRARGTLECTSSKVRAPVTVRCGLIGPIIAVGVGFEGPTPFAPSTCGCNVDDVLGSQTGILGTAGPFSANVSGCGKGPFSIGPRTVSIGLGKSFGAGLAFTKCTVAPRGPITFN
jgi:RHS repeat-associated protein